MLYSRLSITLFLIAVTFASLSNQFAPPPQTILTSISSSPIDFLFSFAFDGDTILLGGNSSVVNVSLSDLSQETNVSTNTSTNVPYFARATECLFSNRAGCRSNIIEHVFPFANSFLACGTNAGADGCSLFQGTDFSSTNDIRAMLSGDVSADASLSTDTQSYAENALYFNAGNDVMYSLVNSGLDVYNFTDFAPMSSPTNTSLIPLLVSTFSSGGPGTLFFNTPAPGNLFRYAYDSSTDLDYIHIPFTESVLENPLLMDVDYIFLRNSFHGRLARICTNDLGQFANYTDNSVLIDALGSFNKITIDCRQALGVRYPEDTSYVSIALKDLFIIDTDNIYGFFTSQIDAEEFIQSSAVCRFISDPTNVTQTFNLETGFQATYFEGYDTMELNEVAWNCANPDARRVDARTLSDISLEYILHTTVVYNEASLAIDKHFESVLRDSTLVRTSSGDTNISLFYATTFDGFLIKMKVESGISLVGEFQVTNDGSALFNAEIREIDNIKYLFAISNDQLLRTSLQLCSEHCSAIACYQDPECVWSSGTRTCDQYDQTSVRTVPSEESLVVDGTCALSFVASSTSTLMAGITCELKLPSLNPNISVVSLDSISIASANIEYSQVNATDATITVGGLEDLTPYVITVMLSDPNFCASAELVLPAYTDASLVLNATQIDPVCATAVTETGITLNNTVTFPDVLQVCVTCGADMYCSVHTSHTVVAFDFPWRVCSVTTASFTYTGAMANSSECPPLTYNRCAQSTSFQHLDFSFESTATTITIHLHEGNSIPQFGITGYTFTVDGMSEVFTGNYSVFSDLSPATQYTVDYTATTECSSLFMSSTDVTTQPDWSPVQGCTFSNAGQTFEYTVANPALCTGDVTDCMDVTSNCILNFTQMSTNTISYDVTSNSELCSVDVYPAGRSDLLAYYGCSDRVSYTTIFQIAFGTISVTTNSVIFDYIITPLGQRFRGQIELLSSASDVIEEYTIIDQLSGNSTTGFSNLTQNTTYTIRITVGSTVNSIDFTTMTKIVLNLRCSPISNYGVEFDGEMYDLTIIRDNSCEKGSAATHICLITMDVSNAATLYLFGTMSRIIPDLDVTQSYAFALLANISSVSDCPPMTDSAYRYIYKDSLFQTTTSTPSPTTTASPPLEVNLGLVTASVSLFYTAVGTSSVTVLVSATGLSVLFGLIIVYPKLLKKAEASANAKDPQVKEGYELPGMNPIDDTAS